LVCLSSQQLSLVFLLQKSLRCNPYPVPELQPSTTHEPSKPKPPDDPVSQLEISVSSWYQCLSSAPLIQCPSRSLLNVQVLNRKPKTQVHAISILFQCWRDFSPDAMNRATDHLLQVRPVELLTYLASVLQTWPCTATGSCATSSVTCCYVRRLRRGGYVWH
jgi:hypothetical protein